MKIKCINIYEMLKKQCSVYSKCVMKVSYREFPGSPVRTPRFHCRGHGLHPWLGN